MKKSLIAALLLLPLLILLGGCGTLGDFIRDPHIERPAWEVDLELPLLPKTRIDVGDELAELLNIEEEKLMIKQDFDQLIDLELVEYLDIIDDQISFSFNEQLPHIPDSLMAPINDILSSLYPVTFTLPNISDYYVNEFKDIVNNLAFENLTLPQVPESFITELQQEFAAVAQSFNNQVFAEQLITELKSVISDISRTINVPPQTYTDYQYIIDLDFNSDIAQIIFKEGLITVEIENNTGTTLEGISLELLNQDREHAGELIKESTIITEGATGFYDFRLSEIQEPLTPDSELRLTFSSQGDTAVGGNVKLTAFLNEESGYNLELLQIIATEEQSFTITNSLNLNQLNGPLEKVTFNNGTIVLDFEWDELWNIQESNLDVKIFHNDNELISVNEGFSLKEQQFDFTQDRIDFEITLCTDTIYANSDIELFLQLILSPADFKNLVFREKQNFVEYVSPLSIDLPHLDFEGALISKILFSNGGIELNISKNQQLIPPKDIELKILLGTQELIKKNHNQFGFDQHYYHVREQKLHLEPQAIYLKEFTPGAVIEIDFELFLNKEDIEALTFAEGLDVSSSINITEFDLTILKDAIEYIKLTGGTFALKPLDYEFYNFNLTVDISGHQLPPVAGEENTFYWGTPQEPLRLEFAEAILNFNYEAVEIIEFVPGSEIKIQPIIKLGGADIKIIKLAQKEFITADEPLHIPLDFIDNLPLHSLSFRGGYFEIDLDLMDFLADLDLTIWYDFAEDDITGELNLISKLNVDDENPLRFSLGSPEEPVVFDFKKGLLIDFAVGIDTFIPGAKIGANINLDLSQWEEAIIDFDLAFFDLDDLTSLFDEQIEIGLDQIPSEFKNIRPNKEQIKIDLIVDNLTPFGFELSNLVLLAVDEDNSIIFDDENQPVTEIIAVTIPPHSENYALDVSQLIDSFYNIAIHYPHSIKIEGGDLDITAESEVISITRDLSFSLSAGIEIGLSLVIAKDITEDYFEVFIDPIPVEIESNELDLIVEWFRSASLYYEIINHMPLDGEITIFLGESSADFYETALFISEAFGLPLAQLNEEGLAIGPSESHRYQLGITSQALELFTLEDLYLGAKLTIPFEGETKTITFSRGDYVEFQKVWADIKILIDTGNIPQGGLSQ